MYIRKIGKVKIGNNVFVGADALILPGVTIGDNVIIGARTIINKNIDFNSVVVGNTARVVSTYNEFFNKKRMLLDKRPVFKKYWVDITLQEKLKMRELLVDDIRFEP